MKSALMQIATEVPGGDAHGKKLATGQQQGNNRASQDMCLWDSTAAQSVDAVQQTDELLLLDKSANNGFDCWLVTAANLIAGRKRETLRTHSSVATSSVVSSSK